jgi:hypothetical protein
MKCEADIQKMYDDAQRELDVLREQFRCEPVPFVREMLEVRIVSKQAYVYALEQVLNIESEACDGSA